MEITREEQQMLADFRRLAPAQRQELLVFARGLAAGEAPVAAVAQEGQCSFERKPVKSSADEPMFTE